MSTRMVSFLVLLLAALLPLGCQQRVSRAPVRPDVPPCWLTHPPGASGRAGTISVALLDPVEPAGAPLASSDSERLVFGQLYETLVVVDCAGRAQPGLARSWSVDSDGVHWVFVLREDARFSDGSPLGAGAVSAAWEDSRARAAAEGTGATAAVWSTLAEGAAWGRGDTLKVAVIPPIDRDGRFFADPALAVTKPGRRPLGSGPFRWAEGSARLVPNPNHPRPGASEVVLEAAHGSDPRDVLAAGADVVLVRDREAVAYAAGTDHVAAVPLPWDLRYVAWVSSPPPLSESDRRDLAADLAQAVAVSEARPAPSWPYPECRGGRDGLPDTGAPLAAGDIAYVEGDPDAEALAARLAALASANPSRPWLGPFRGTRIRAVPWRDLRRRLASGAPGGLLVLPHRILPDPCPPPGGAAHPHPFSGGVLVPLMDTRTHLLVRRGLEGFVIDGTGTVHLSRVVRVPTP